MSPLDPRERDLVKCEDMRIHAERDTHDAVVAVSRASGNAPVDLLTCVPPGMVGRDGHGRRAVAADLFSG